VVEPDDVSAGEVRELARIVRDLTAVVARMLDGGGHETATGGAGGGGLHLGDPVERLGLSPPVEVDVETPLREVAEVLAGEAIGAVLVRAPSGLVGIVSERDIVVAAAAGADLDAATAGEVMAESVVSIEAGESLAAAAATMAGRDVRHLPVLRDGRAVGMVSARDVLSALAPPTG
jgi:CBS domain-containing protein